tara:strand:+ start:202 stop:801 length:600 start_codon:yes stop_codon:yes gene_type:complete
MEFENEVLFTTTQVDKIFEALAKAQGQFKILHKSHDGYHGKYANLQDIQFATQEALSSNGLSITQSHDQSKIKSVLGHSSGQHIVYITKFKDVASDKFKQASAWTFMRRYAILAMLNISGDEDPESYGDVSFTSDDGLGEKAKKFLDKALGTKEPSELNKYISSIQLDLKRLEKDDPDEYGFISKKFSEHKKTLSKKVH